VNVPERDPDRPQNDPWDADAVRYLLSHAVVAQRWSKSVLFECLREQPGRRKTMPQRVEEAARLAEIHGVERRREGSVLNFFRTDLDRPDYPAGPDERRVYR